MRGRILFLLVMTIPLAGYGQPPLRVSGEVLIQNHGPRKVLAYVQPDAHGISHVFRVSSEEPFSENPVWHHFERAEVTLSEGRLTIVAPGRGAVIFAVRQTESASVDSDERERIARDVIGAGLRNVVVLTGYGLAARTREPGLSIAVVKRSPEVAATDENPDAGACGESGGGS